MDTLISLADVSTSVPCVALPTGGVKCTCPTYGPGGAYMPVTAPDGSWYCQLALETPPPPPQAAPVPSLSSVALGVLFVALAAVGAWKIQQ